MPVKSGGFKPKGKVKGFKRKGTTDQGLRAKLNGKKGPPLDAFEPIKIHELKRHGHYWTIKASVRGEEPAEYQNKSVAWFTVEPDPRSGLFREALPRVAAEFNEHLLDYCRKTNQHPRLTRWEVNKLEMAETVKKRNNKGKPGKENEKKDNPFTARASRRRHRR